MKNIIVIHDNFFARKFSMGWILTYPMLILIKKINRASRKIVWPIVIGLFSEPLVINIASYFGKTIECKAKIGIAKTNILT